MPDRNRDFGPSTAQLARLAEAVLAQLEGEESRARRILMELLLELADARCDGCGEEFSNEAERHDALGARLGGYLGVCSDCLRKRSTP